MSETENEVQNLLQQADEENQEGVVSQDSIKVTENVDTERPSDIGNVMSVSNTLETATAPRAPTL